RRRSRSRIVLPAGIAARPGGRGIALVHHSGRHERSAAVRGGPGSPGRAAMSDAGTDTTLLEQTLSRLFTERSGQEARQAAEAEGWASDCWDALAESGLPWVGVPEDAGGSGGDVSDACTLVRLAGRHAGPLPLAECSLIGGWLVAAAGLQLPGGEPISVATPRAGDRVR